MKEISITRETTRVHRYTPAAIGNGDLSLLIDYEGMQRQTEDGWGKLVPGIWRAGHRYNTMRGELIPFGYFLTEVQTEGEPVDFRQSLDPRCGLVKSECVYQDGSRVSAETFCCLHRNVVVLKRRWEAPEGRVFRLRYFFNPKYAELNWNGNGAIDYSIDGIRIFQGRIQFESDAPFSFRREEDAFVWSTESREFVLMLRFDDAGPLPSADELLEQSRREWNKYWSEGFVKVPSEKLQRMYDLAQYHLRISSTAWGMPTGIYASHWHSLFFAFDEYFMFMGLATSGHLETAARIPAFRHSIRASANRRMESGKVAREPGVLCYPWETNEIGEENSSRGFWYDHIFHASHIALAAYEAFRFSGDRVRLAEQWYPLIWGSVEYLRIVHIVRGKDGTAEIGCCTDLERLGAMRTNPFMTACSVIATLRAAAETAEVLGKDADLISLWRRLAEELRKNLPHDAVRYLPYEGCPPDVHSIGQFAGIYPYGVLEPEDPLQRGACTDYLQSRDQCGNMYASAGKGICSWYLCWESLMESSRGNGDRACEVLETLADSCGCFGELFEIYSCGYRPWFTTAEGEMVHALNNMLLQFHPDGSPRVAPAVPSSWREFEFRLQGRGGKRIEAVFRNGSLNIRQIPSGKAES